ncbi:hypothetical protein [Chryseobacterium sp.]|uniref:hypothetical protein n=1 Tax=Chryseobacterium sp. TaxID=1871047 RepID=UPI002898D23B|nr:hypothetical protein [Chryseobacterium sp.]
MKKIYFLFLVLSLIVRGSTEVVINFEKKNLIFRAMYPFIPEPPPPPTKAGKTKPFTNPRKLVKPYFANLADEDLKYFKSLIKSLSTSDYKMIEDVYIDGTSYNFGILFSNKISKNGFIAPYKTENQEKIILEILRLMHKTNPHEDNLEILQYYSRHN